MSLVLAGSAIEDSIPALPTWLGVTLVLLLVFGVQLGYPIGFETFWSGRTPGKAALGLRVVTVEGAPVGFRHAAIRAALGLVDFQLTVGAAGVLTALASQRTQRLGDIVAGTLVLRERTGAGIAVAERFPVPAGLEGHAEQLDVTALGPADYQAVRSFLQRAARLDPATRRRLAGQLADTVAPKVRPGPPSGVPPDAWLQAVAAAYQRRSRPTAARRPVTDVYRPTGWERPGAGATGGGTAGGPADPPPGVAAEARGDADGPAAGTGFTPPR